MVSLRRVYDGVYSYGDDFMVDRLENRWYVWDCDKILADFATLRECREYLYYLTETE